MCGVAGVLNFNGKHAVKAEIEKMLEVIKHRGPDDEGVYINNNIGLGHRRLSIIDLSSAGHQPMSNEDNSVWLTYNGEIYNYPEIKNELINKGHIFKSNTDAEVVIHSYEEWGADCVKRFNGMWAFAVWDDNNNRLFCSRDRFGIKPFYYYKDDKRFIFASEIKSILAYKKSTQLNYSGLGEYLLFQVYMSDETLFKDIHKLMPAHNLVIERNHLSINNYWSSDYNINLSIDEKEAVNNIRDLINSSVKKRLMSEVPLGTYLSGGIDSSVVTILSNLNYTNELNVFTGTFKGYSEYDETRYAMKVSEKYNCRYNEVNITDKDFVESFESLIYYLDEPVAGPGIFPQYCVAKFAKEKIKVLLGGQGGDELFGGYARYLVAYLEQALKYSILEGEQEDKFVVTLHKVLPNLYSLKNYIPMIKKFFSKGMFDTLDKRYFNLICRMDLNDTILKEGIKDSLKFDRVMEKYYDLFNSKNIQSSFDRMSNFDTGTLLPGLLQVEDRVSMANSIETRVPLLDHNIFDYITKISPVIKFKNGTLKYLLKESFRDVLPPEIYSRKDKMGFPVPLNLWLKKGLARDYIYDNFLSTDHQLKFFKKEEIIKIINTETPYNRTLWGVLSLEQWAKTFKVEV